MKKNYFITLFFTILLSAISFGQNVIVTGYMDSPCPNQAGRTLEIYVDGSVDFTGWSVVRQSNGGGFSPGSSTIDISALGNVSNSFVYITNNEAALSAEFGVTANILVSGNINGNGDDGFQVVNNSAIVVDRFGVDGEDASGKNWEHEDSYVYRKDGSTPNSGNFNVSNWIIGALNLLDNKGLCNGDAALSTLVPFGSFKTTASTTPELFVGNSISGLDYFEGNGPSAEKEITVSGDNLTSDVTITAPTSFEVSLTSGSGFASSVNITPTSGSVSPTTVYVRLISGLGVNTYSGDITIASTGADSKTVAVSGEVKPADPQFFYTAFLDQFNYISGDGPSAEQDFSVEGLFLTNDLIITAPSNFELSLTSGSGFSNSVSITPASGTIVSTTIYIRLKSGLSEGTYNGDVTLSSTNLADKTFSIEGKVFGDVTKSMIITGIFDGPLTGGTPKGVELYVFKDIPDLSVFGVSSVSNGGGSTAGNVEFPFPADQVTAGTFIYVATESTEFNNFFGFAPTYVTGTVSINGDDSIELYENGKIIDVFGDVNKDGSGEAWDHVDGWAYRKANSQPGGTVFTVSEWIFSGIDVFDGQTKNSETTPAFPVGTFTGTLSSRNNLIQGFAIYPNPVNNNRFVVSSNSTNTKQVSIYNVLGKNVFNTTISGTKSEVNIPTIAKGLYILKVVEGTKTATSKLIIK